MKKKKTGWKLTTKSFAAYFTVIFLVFCILLAGIFLFNAGREMQRYRIECAARTEELTQRVSEKLSGVTASANAIFSARWFVHFHNNAGVYDTEFDALKRKEISQDLNSRLIGMEFVSDILILTPALDSCIDQNGWYSMEDYGFFYDKVRFSEDAERIEAAKPAQCVLITLQDTNSRMYRSVICLLIDRARFARYMEALTDDRLSSLQLTLNGQTLYDAGEPGGIVREAASLGTPKLQVTATYPATSDTMRTLQMMLALELLAALLFSLIAAYLLTRLSAKPVERLLEKYENGTRGDGESAGSVADAAAYLDRYIEGVERSNRELEQNTVKVSRFFGMLHRELLFAMLQSPDFDWNDEHTASVIPWISEGLPYVLALAEAPETEEDTEVPARLLAACETLEKDGTVAHCIHHQVIAGEQVMIFWLPRDKDPAAQMEAIRRRLTEAVGYPYDLALSPETAEGLPTELSELRERYIELKNGIRERSRKRLDLPVTLQMRLIAGIQASRQAEVKSVLAEAREVAPPEAVLLLLLRIAQEYGVDSRGAIHSFRTAGGTLSGQEHMWNVLISFSSDICREIGETKKQNTDQSAALIRQMIDDEYQNPDMSIKLLSERFSLDGSLISRIFKAAYGVSFSDYLQEKRMRRARAMLAEVPGKSAAQIALEVGYANYLSFKRAFLRCQGISPVEYRSLHQADGERQAGTIHAVEQD